MFKKAKHQMFSTQYNAILVPSCHLSVTAYWAFHEQVSRFC